MQTAYNVDPVRGVVGAIAESGAKTTRAKVSNGAVRPGQYVTITGATCQHPSAQPTALTRGGVVLRNPYKQADAVYYDNEMVDVVEEGQIWVAAEAPVLVDTQAFVRCVASGAEQLGAFRHNADTADAFAIPGLVFRTAGTALVKLEVKKYTT